MIKLIVGLGNPGDAYEATRHNAGFWLVDGLAAQTRINLRYEQRFYGEVGRMQHGSDSIWLLKPQTFMNRSGQSVGALVRFHQIAPKEILVVHDELDLAPGVAKLKFDGGSGGHNGLKDIAAHLGGTDFWRLRIGIGHPRDLVPTNGAAKIQHDVANYVLKPPRREEQEKIEDVMCAAQPALELLFQGETAAAMQKLNSMPKM